MLTSAFAATNVAMIVGDSSSLTTWDLNASSRLSDANFTVTYVDDGNTTFDADNYGAMFISNSAGGQTNAVNNNNDTGVGVVVNKGLFVETMGLCSDEVSSTTQQGNVVNNTEYITGNMSTGNFNLFDSSQSYNYCNNAVGSGATVLVERAGAATRKLVYQYENQSTDAYSNAAAGRRVGLYHADTDPAIYTEDSWNIMVRSVEWAAYVNGSVGGSGNGSGNGSNSTYSGNLVINMTGASLTQDSSNLSHTFTVNNGVTLVNDSTICKYYECFNFTQNTRGGSNDYLSSTAQWSDMDGMTIAFWVYYTNPGISGGTSQGLYRIGSGVNEKKSQNQGSGNIVTWDAATGTVTETASSNSSETGIWMHIFQSYDGSRFYEWIDGELQTNSSEPYGALNHSNGDVVELGTFGSTIDMQGYMDEILVWNTSIVNQSFVDDLYNSQRLGTPVAVDLHVESIKYQVPVNYSHENNSFIYGVEMPINITIKNSGFENANSTGVNVWLNDSIVCSYSVQLNAGATHTYNCNITTSDDFLLGSVSINHDNVEDTYDNNNISLYVPMKSRPYVFFSLEDWEDVMEPFATNTSNEVAYDSYDWADSFSCSAFNPGYDGDQVDPFGKKTAECAITCMINDYNSSNIACQRAHEHVLGWANRSVTSYTNVQNIQELSWVALGFDIMWPYLSQTEIETVSEQYHDISQHIFNLNNVRPDLDNDDHVNGGNGAGFGSGMGGFTMWTMGLYPENPTQIQSHAQERWGENMVDEWIGREQRYLYAYKNNSNATYQEGLSYKWYSQEQLVQNWYWQKKYGLNNLAFFQNALDAMGKEMLYIFTDCNYNGNLLRGDVSYNCRAVQKGDSHSYEDPGSQTLLSWDIGLVYGLLTDNTTLKQNLLWQRDHAFDAGDGVLKYFGQIFYPLLWEEAGAKTQPNLPNIMFDGANDIFMYRDSYTYVNDTIIWIDGGEERGSGHSHAQGYYFYFMGEPFIDYEQVPYDDDTQAETWKNGISLRNDTQSMEGQASYYSETCGNAVLNQYYGMRDCPNPTISGDWPDYRHFPVEYGGEVTNYSWTDDMEIFGVHVYRPYQYADEPVKEWFLKVGDALFKRSKVEGSNESNVWHNFISLYDEYNYTISGTSMLQHRESVNGDLYVNTSLIWENGTNMVFGGGETQVNACTDKTDCSGANRLNTNYARTYLYTPDSDVDFIFVHNAYTGSAPSVESYVSGSDQGANYSGMIVLFDTNDDGNITYNSTTYTTWGLVVNETSGETFSVMGNSSFESNESDPVDPTLGLTFSPSTSVTNGTTTTVTGTSCPAGLTCTLYRDDVSVSNPDVQTLGVGSYSYVYNTSGNENYTAASVSGTLTVTASGGEGGSGSSVDSVCALGNDFSDGMSQFGLLAGLLVLTLVGFFIIKYANTEGTRAEIAELTNGAVYYGVLAIVVIIGIALIMAMTASFC